MNIVKNVDTEKRHFISNVYFLGLKPRKPKEFRIELWISMINDLAADLVILNGYPNGNDMNIALDGEIPIDAIPEFAISFRCFLKFENCNDDAREKVASALSEVITQLPTTRVVITKKANKVSAELILGEFKLKGEVDHEWANHLFK